jgi:NADH dehydrogenase
MATIGRGSNVTVIGGSGFIGRYVIRHLAELGCQIRVAVRHPDRALFLKTCGEVGQVTPVAVNIRDQASVEAAVAGADAVINLVGILYQSGAQKFVAIQAEGAGRVAKAAQVAGATHFIHLSAIGADGTSKAGYASSKAAGERAVLAAFPTATILRPSIVFGPEDDFFNRFAAMAMISPVLPLIGGGRTRFQPIYVGDVARAVIKALQLPEAAGQIYELGGPGVYTFRALLELLLRQINRRRCLVTLPFALASLQGAVLQHLPSPPLTMDQVRLLHRDNVVDPRAKTIADLDIVPTALDSVLPGYLDRYRPRDRFAR